MLLLIILLCSGIIIGKIITGEECTTHYCILDILFMTDTANCELCGPLAALLGGSPSLCFDCSLDWLIDGDGKRWPHQRLNTFQITVSSGMTVEESSFVSQ